MARKNEGMMWWVRDKKATAEEQVREAVAYFAKKYGVQPSVCCVNLVDFAEKRMPEAVDGVVIRPDREILREHMWICDHSDEPNDSEFEQSSNVHAGKHLGSEVK